MTYEDVLERLAALGPELRTHRAADGSAVTSATTARRKFSLDHIRALLRALGDPQSSFAAVLIAGTNGKGSTAATLASIANAARLRTGLYTSPHLLRVNERIQTSIPSAVSPSSPSDLSPPSPPSPASPPCASGLLASRLIEIPDADFGRVYGLVNTAIARLIANTRLPHYPSYFELMTAIAFTWFAEQRVELAVLEVGLGGRLDATNSVEPIVSVIADIGIDHTEYLGNTIGEIAGEKAGILRRDGVLVTLAQHPEANSAIGAKAVELNVRGIDAARYLPPARDLATQPAGSAHAIAASVTNTANKALLARNRYDLILQPLAIPSQGAAGGAPGEVLHVDSPLAGRHQQRNIALALATAIELRTNHHLVDGRPFDLPNAAIEQGVRDTQWPGRLEWIPEWNSWRNSWRNSEPNPQRPPCCAPLLLDVAHNPAAAWTLRAALAQLPERLPRTLIFGCLADKRIGEMEQIILPLFDSTSGDPARSRDHIVLVPVQNSRTATVEELAAAAARLDIPVHRAGDLREALDYADSVTPSEGVIVATGSVFLVGEIRALALRRVADSVSC